MDELLFGISEESIAFAVLVAFLFFCITIIAYQNYRYDKLQEEKRQSEAELKDLYKFLINKFTPLLEQLKTAFQIWERKQ